MKLNLIKTLDTTKLDAAILGYKPRYLIMNLETANDMNEKVVSLDRDKYLGADYIAFYRNTPIAYCEQLKYGEVELVV